MTDISSDQSFQENEDKDISSETQIIMDQAFKEKETGNKILENECIILSFDRDLFFILVQRKDKKERILASEKREERKKERTFKNPSLLSFCASKILFVISFQSRK